MEEKLQGIVEEVKSEILQKYPDAEISLQTVAKNNGVAYPTLSVGRGTGVNAIIRLESIAKALDGGECTAMEVSAMLVDMVMQQFANMLQEVGEKTQGFWENPQKEKIRLEVVNKSMNAEMLKNTPHRDVGGDLAVIGRYQVVEDGSAVISNELAARMGMTPSEVIEAGICNMQAESYRVQSMISIMADMMGLSEGEAEQMFGQEAGMYVVTNESKVYGATGIFVDKNLRKEVAEIIGEDYYILPSSIHECICVSADTMSPEAARDMIQEVNAGELLPEEVLSDHPYLVDGQNLKITNPCKTLVEAVADMPKLVSAIHM